MSLGRPWVVLPIGPNGCDTGDEVTYWQHTGYAISQRIRRHVGKAFG